MAAETDGLEPECQIIVTALANGQTRQQAADAAGISLRTVGRRLERSDVRFALATERRSRADEISDALAAAIPATVRRLLNVAEEGSDRDAVNAGRVLLSEGRDWKKTTRQLRAASATTPGKYGVDDDGIPRGIEDLTPEELQDRLRVLHRELAKQVAEWDRDAEPTDVIRAEFGQPR